VSSGRNNDCLGFDSLWLATDGWLHDYVVVSIKSTATRNYPNTLFFQDGEHVFGLALGKGNQSAVYGLQINLDLWLDILAID
jgi:hypothetical protein